MLKAIAAEAPQWKITHAETLRDQGLVATGILERVHPAGDPPRPPRPTPAPAVAHCGRRGVGGRQRDLIAVGLAAGVRPIPAQQVGEYDLLRQETADREETPVPESWADKRMRLEAEVAGTGRHRPCAGDEGMCPRFALPDTDLCAVCLGGEQPVCGRASASS